MFLLDRIKAWRSRTSWRPLALWLFLFAARAAGFLVADRLGGSHGLMIAMTVIYPSLIAPLFNTFTPLPQGQLKTRIEALLAKCGFESNGLYVMDASKRSTHGNAYFTGFGKAKRIVFSTRFCKTIRPNEILSILAHELVIINSAISASGSPRWRCSLFWDSQSFTGHSRRVWPAPSASQPTPAWY